MGPSDYTYLPGFSKKLPDGPLTGAPVELSDTEIRSDALRYSVESFEKSTKMPLELVDGAILKRARIFEDYIRNG